MLNKLLQLLFGGKLGERGVSLAEMESLPQLIAHADHLEIRVWNSLQHSSLSIYQVRFRIADRAILLTGHQRLVSSPQNPTRFTFSYQELGIDPAQLADYSVLWLDPDGRTTPLSTLASPR